MHGGRPPVKATERKPEHRRGPGVAVPMPMRRQETWPERSADRAPAASVGDHALRFRLVLDRR